MNPPSAYRVTSHRDFGEFGKPADWESRPLVGAPPPPSLCAWLWRIIFAALALFWGSVFLLAWIV